MFNLKISLQEVASNDGEVALTVGTILLFDNNGKNLPKKETAIISYKDSAEYRNDIENYNDISCFGKYILVELI